MDEMTVHEPETTAEAPENITDLPVVLGSASQRASTTKVPAAPSLTNPPRMTYPPLPSYPVEQMATPAALSSGLGLRPITDAVLRAIQVSPLAKRFPRNYTIATGAGAFGAVLLTFLIEAIGLHGDWAQSALATAVVALGLAAFTMAVTGMRVALGRRGRQFVLLSGSLILALLLAGVSAIGTQHAIHVVQARFSEQHGQWPEAISQWELAGERAPNATNVTRDYIVWGDQLASQGKYAQAAIRYDAAIGMGSAIAPLQAQVQASQYKLYTRWLSNPTADLPYADAIAALTTHRTDAGCDATCKAESGAIEAQARVTFGQQLISTQHFADAVSQLEVVGAQLTDTTYVAQAHTLAATANLGLGKQLRAAAGTCTQAIPVYLHLKDQYADTPEGAQAKKDLVAPQSVTGKITGFPTNPFPRVHLSFRVNTSFFIFSNEYNVTLDASGAFTFASVSQGYYNLSTSRDLGWKVDYNVYHGSGGADDLYFVQVGPLCAVNLGTITY
jgi:tetratricopeptide (TPR) repeat protein